ncbi:MAG: S-adenosylmethionine:tRNA ribosyltransferase-isomerase, partial [Flavobacteriales bacterium]|nr:S-adenosylmethionine:tRNA ribosyltransferase-isomerase [Flavobacteriales bacterium]
MSDPRTLRIADYHYELPEERIAKHPPADRGQSRLLVRRDGSISDSCFTELSTHLPAESVIVLNNTRVVKARLFFTKESGARIEILCLDPADQGPMEQAMDRCGGAEWWCTVGNLKKWKGGRLNCTGGPPVRRIQVCAEAMERRGGEVRVRFSWKPDALTFSEVLDTVGEVPLPPYMDRDAETDDTERYQTVFAVREGSVAAPTAGLHFTPDLFADLSKAGHERIELTLHVGAGTFKPVKSERMEDHAMHSERIEVPVTTVEA